MRHLYRLILLIATLILFTACQSDDPDGVIPTRISVNTETSIPAAVIPTTVPTTIPTQASNPTPRSRAIAISDQSYIRFVHALVGLNDVDMLISGRAIALNFNYRSLTEITEIEAGNYTLSIRVDKDILIEQPLDIQGRQTLTIVLTGTPDVPVINIFAEDAAPLNANQTRVQLIHAVPGGPAVQARSNGAAITDTPLTFTQKSPSIVVPSENTLFTLHENDQLLASHQVTLRERHIYTLVFIGNPADASSYDMIAFYTRVPGLATVRAVNAAEVNTPLDIYINGELLFGSVDYSHTTHRQTIPTGSYTTEVFPSGTGYGAGSPSATFTLNADADNNVTLVLMGEEGQIRLARHNDDLSPVAPETARITFVHAAPKQNMVRLLIGDTPPADMPDLARYQLSSNIILEANQSHTFDWVSLDNGGAPVGSVETAMNIQLQEGQNYIYLMNERGTASPILFNETVGIDESLLDVNSAPTEEPVQPALVRVVNALGNDIAVDFFIDNIPLVASVANRQLTDPILVSSGIRQISIRPANSSDNTSIQHEFEFLENGNYTIYAYGTEPQFANFRVFANADMIEGDTGTLVRLVNLTQENHKVVFDLVYVEGELDLAAPPSDTIPPFRETLPLGTSKLISDVTPESASIFVNLASIPADFYIMDTPIDMVATKLLDVPLEAGTQYDIVAYQHIDSPQVTAYIISYK